jgi:aspartyl-tRNA(Asn)/glutamyl-tRNA(Gln) amidotransferase subunit C
MELSHENVRAIAELAKLELTEAEIDLYTSQLSAILDYFEHLQSVDTSHIDSTASVLPLRSVMRADATGDPLTPAEVTTNAPDSEDNQFRVSAVLDE